MKDFDSLINQKLDQAIYIDSDMIPTGNISYLFQFFTELEDYPLIQKGLFEYQINYGRGNPFHNGGFDKTNILKAFNDKISKIAYVQFNECHIKEEKKQMHLKYVVKMLPDYQENQ